MNCLADFVKLNTMETTELNDQKLCESWTCSSLLFSFETHAKYCPLRFLFLKSDIFDKRFEKKHIASHSTKSGGILTEFFSRQAAMCNH